MWAAIPGRRRWVRVYFLWRPNLPDEADNPSIASRPRVPHALDRTSVVP